MACCNESLVIRLCADSHTHTHTHTHTYKTTSRFVTETQGGILYWLIHQLTPEQMWPWSGPDTAAQTGHGVTAGAQTAAADG